MATTPEAQTAPKTDPYRDAIDEVVGDDILIDLDRVARLLNLPSREAVRYRMRRGTLPLRSVQPGGRTAETLVPAADVYQVLGLDWTPPAGPSEVVARVLPDGTVHLSTTSLKQVTSGATTVKHQPGETFTIDGRLMRECNAKYCTECRAPAPTFNTAATA